MKKANLKKLSILGLVLMSASAITAAIIPAQKNDNTSKDLVAGDSQTQSFDAGGRGATMTCAFTNDKTAGNTCDVTANSGTTDGFPASSDANHTNTTLI